MKKLYAKLQLNEQERFTPDSISQSLRNTELNRYSDIHPYNHSLPFSYINASVIDGKFIASQAPLPPFTDFHRLLEEFSVECIVMLASLDEGERKINRYWDDFSEGRVTINGKKYDHLQFSWKDHSVPTSSILSLIQASMKYKRVVVHCSAGCGRTGTFIACYYVYLKFLEGSLKNPEEDIYQIVNRLRERRMMMVQTFRQYEYIHEFADKLLTSE